MKQSSLFQRYCIDASAILDFWDSSPTRTRPYHVKVKSFRAIWEHVSSEVENGTIIVPKITAKEITTEIPELKNWLESHKKAFVGHSYCVNELAQIVKKYPIYTTKKASLADAIVVSVAMNSKLTVITSEFHTNQPNLVKPKIPNVCDDFSVKWMNLPDFFEAEGL